ncbi:AAA family ATPase [Oscillatoria salina]|uniref:AAA family ATPase n=1 Tax=Oscillatoria salina TaxID=331517 RepID=UPI001CC9FD0D|nr:AAA family ATPase [Oscillatoria salina]MBZ8181349.1 AAA family ATPase [Oscillatoria salina IIICB1]
MKLISLKLANFRQFYGKTPEIFLANDEGNTTIIHGNNGAGKTTILNAFTWVLYEKFTAAFASPHQLVNKRAITEADFNTSVECFVEILFEHENKSYQIKRQCYAYRDKNNVIQYSQTKLFMLIAGDDGLWCHPLQQPTDIINRILPESLHQYFFFDGERIDHFFRSDQKSSIAEDTKELLGVKVLDRAIEHLKKAKRTLQDELTTIGDTKTKQLLREQKQTEKTSETLQERHQEINQELAHLSEFKQAINQRLLELSGAEELQQLKEKLLTQEKTIRENIIHANNSIKESLSRRGLTIFLDEARAKFAKIIAELRSQGELPTGIKQQFVDDLLSQQRCICGTELTPGTNSYQLVQSWQKKAGIPAVEEAAIRLDIQVKEIGNQVNKFWQEVDAQQANINQWRSELAQIENELDETKEKLRTYPDEDIQRLQKRLDETEIKIRELTLEQGANQQEITRLNQEIAGKIKQIAKHKHKEEKQVLAQKRIEITQEAINRVIEVRTRLERQFRYSLEKRVQEIFASISFTPYQPRISTEYELKLIENTSGIAISVAASTGENQILSLSFIGGIIDRVREWSQKNTLMGPDSSTFPIIMDSPFGSLDEIYRRQVAKAIPKLANQLVVLVTKTQWRGEVATEMADCIGKQYILVYHSPKPDCEEDFIEINQVSYPLVKPSSDSFEYTEIIEVTK